MRILDKLVIGGKLAAVGGALAAVGSGIAFLVKDARETAKRKSTPPEFDERLTEQDFTEIVTRIAQSTPRVVEAVVDGLVVNVSVRSNTGLTQWNAALDFNDYGHATGKHWIKTENRQSLIPEFFAKALRQEILQRMG